MISRDFDLSNRHDSLAHLHKSKTFTSNDELKSIVSNPSGLQRNKSDRFDV